MRRSLCAVMAAAMLVLPGCARDPQAVFERRMTVFLDAYKALMPYVKKAPPKDKWLRFQSTKQSVLAFSSEYPASPYADDAFFLALMPDFMLSAAPTVDTAIPKAMITRMKAYMADHASGKVEEKTRQLFHQVLGPLSGGMLLYIPFDQVTVFMEFFLASERGDWTVQTERFETLKKSLAPLIKDNQRFAQELYLPVYIGMAKTGDIAAMRAMVKEVEEKYPGSEFAGFITKVQGNYEKTRQCPIK